MGNIRERLVGCWRLVSYQLIADNGDTRKPIGDDPTGTILYTQDGYMSAQLTKPGPYDRNDLPIAYYIAYSGPYDVDEENSIVIHHVEVAVIPSWLGSAQKRRAHFRGADELVLSQTTNDPSGSSITHTLTWSRAPSRR